MAFNFYRLSVRMQITLLVVAVFLPALAVLVWHHMMDRQGARAIAYERVRMLAHHTAANLESTLRDHEALLGRLALRPRVKALDGHHCDPIIDDYVSLHPEFANLVIRDLDGKNDCSFQARNLAQAFDSSGYHQARPNMGLTVVDARQGPLTGRWSSLLFYPIQNTQGQSTGLVGLPVDLQQLNERLLGSLPAGARVLVIDKRGKVIMRSRDSALWLAKFDPSELVRLTASSVQGDFSIVGADGVQRLFAFARVPRGDWRVVASVPEEEVLAESNAAVGSGAVLVLAILVFGLGLAWRISLGIVRPIDALNRVAAAVENGKTSRRVQLGIGPRELRSVARQFNQMLDAREGAQSELSLSELRFRTLVALSSDWYWEQDAEFRFIRLDGKLEERTGIPASDFLGKTRWEQRILNLTQADWARHRAIIDGHEEFRNFEIQRLNSRGQVHWAAVSGTPILDARGRFRGYRGVGTDITERKRLEQERLGLSLHIEDLSRRLVQSQEQVRRRFSRELHDRTSPNLAALRINLDIIAMVSPSDHGTQDFADRVADTRALIEDTSISIREICAELHPPVLDIGGLLSAVQSYAQQFAKRTGLQVRVNCPHGEVRLAPALELSLFRIVQEALTNCAKHAHARVVEVRLQLDSSPLSLCVADDGVGFDLDQLAQARHLAGHGLMNMEETAEFAGGEFRVESAPGGGTRVHVAIG